MTHHEREINDNMGLSDGPVRPQTIAMSVVIGTAHETDIAMPITPSKSTMTVDGGPPVEATPAITVMGMPVSHVAELRWARNNDETWLVEVVGTDGEVKTGQCLNAGEVDAVLSFAPYMLPPDHPEYPSE
jgi:hypothetical protein